jgi:hypothetical protein
MPGQSGVCCQRKSHGCAENFDFHLAFLSFDKPKPEKNYDHEGINRPCAFRDTISKRTHTVTNLARGWEGLGATPPRARIVNPAPDFASKKIINRLVCAAPPPGTQVPSIWGTLRLPTIQRSHKTRSLNKGDPRVLAVVSSRSPVRGTSEIGGSALRTCSAFAFAFRSEFGRSPHAYMSQRASSPR